MRTAYEIVSSLLNERGVSSREDIMEFLSEKPQKTYDPFLLMNMRAGVDLILSEARAGTRICVYGDYDADGVTSVCVMMNVLRYLTDDITYYIPSRTDEGYGLNEEAVRKIHEDGAGLIVTVDCGSVSYDEVKLAEELGMKVIVTDHHSIDDRRADCILINPKQEGCPYPFKGLAGCGVAFKTAQAIRQAAGLPRNAVNDMLDLVAVGTVGDVMPLLDENRTIVKYGLYKINSGSRTAMKKLTEGISLSRVTSENIAFGIAPHINAAGRVGSAYDAARLFMSSDSGECESLVEKLISYNSERKKLQEDAYEKGLEMCDPGSDVHILLMEDIHEGIAGIVAGKLKDRFGRPVIIVTPAEEGMLKGTGRSTEGIDIYMMLKTCGDLFEKFGGHSSACGFTLKRERLNVLKEHAERYVEAAKEDDPSVFDTVHRWDIEVSPEEITFELARMIEKMQPFGEGNRRPVLMIRDTVLSNVRFMGSSEEHVRFDAVYGNNIKVNCVLFGKAQDHRQALLSGQAAALSGSLEISEWNGRERLQFIVEDILR